MHTRRFSIVLLLGLGFAGCSSIKPVENLDERTGMTVASLVEPIELVPNSQSGAILSHGRITFAYLGPIEWDQAGTITNGLWVHIAPGNMAPLGDIHAPGALTLVLDDGPLTLSPMAAPKLGQNPYKPVVSWGQTAYFELSEETLKHMAASRKLELDVRAQDDSIESFSADAGAHAALVQYAHGRGITDD